VRGGRTIIFDTKSGLNINFGVLLAQAVLNIILFPLCCRSTVWKMIREGERWRDMGKEQREKHERETEVMKGSVVRIE
jgi:hypothetical protein